MILISTSIEWVVLRFFLLFKAGDHNAFSFHWKFLSSETVTKINLKTETFPILEQRGRNSAHHYSRCLRRFSKNQLWEVIWTITTLFPCNQWIFSLQSGGHFTCDIPCKEEWWQYFTFYIFIFFLQNLVHCYCIKGKVHKTWNVADS